MNMSRKEETKCLKIRPATMRIKKIKTNYTIKIIKATNKIQFKMKNCKNKTASMKIINIKTRIFKNLIENRRFIQKNNTMKINQINIVRDMIREIIRMALKVITNTTRKNINPNNMMNIKIKKGVKYR